MFEIGEIVICVEDYKLPHTREELEKDCPNWVKKGNKYTVRGILDSDFVVGLYLEEVRNNPIYFKLLDRVAEPAFRTDRFEKIKHSEVTVKEEKWEKV